MYAEIDLLNLPITATASVPAQTCVTFDGDPAAEDEPVFGVSQFSQITGREVTCKVLGVAVLKATGAITKGARVISSATGGAKTGGATPANPIGRALTTAADGEFVRVLLGR
ncbi:DUF2190 family protein [Camelimonas lactis]|uniref:Uncharacterized protein DUF2190 n=1 Tax=Camelimonas lactis TaxID=659006 RepID=A0A4V2RXQ8_9HYPH|nr:DUF2190 family protein [Camelimonas lactis]TCO15217.1 uncharacterized protein DUF2190 [Camelimonas lactis]